MTFLEAVAFQWVNPKAWVMAVTAMAIYTDPQRPLLAQLAMFAAATIGMDVISMSAYGLGGAALSARMSEPTFRRGFAVFVGLLLITTAVLILARA